MKRLAIDKEVSVKNYVRKIMIKHGFWKEGYQKLMEDDVYVKTMDELIQLREEDQEMFTALFCRNLLTMAELRDELKEYEDTGLKPIQIKYLKAMYQNTIRDKKKMDAYYKYHRQQSGTWTHGEPQRWWRDENKDPCIKYEDGFWWHYREENGELSWW